MNWGLKAKKCDKRFFLGIRNIETMLKGSYCYSELRKKKKRRLRHFHFSKSPEKHALNHSLLLGRNVNAFSCFCHRCVHEKSGIASCMVGRGRSYVISNSYFRQGLFLRWTLFLEGALLGRQKNPKTQRYNSMKVLKTPELECCRHSNHGERGDEWGTARRRVSKRTAGRLRREIKLFLFALFRAVPLSLP